jgi:thioredoxin reductase (NADPH)
VAAIQQYPTDLVFFTTRDLLEIADMPFGIPEDKPNRRQTIVYYRSVVEHYGIPLALHEEVIAVHPPAGEGGRFTIESIHRGEQRVRRARAVAIATGYFGNPDQLGVPGEELPWVSNRYVEPHRHYGEHVLVVGAGNTGAEAALDMWRNGARVTMAVRGTEVKRSVKYWLKPDVENRIAAGSIEAKFETVVEAFREEGERRLVDLEGPAGRESLEVDAAYVFVGYEPDVTLQAEAGVLHDPETLLPAVHTKTCESNIPGLYIAGTLLAGKATDKIFIENSRDHAPRIVGDLLKKRQGVPA